MFSREGCPFHLYLGMFDYACVVREASIGLSVYMYLFIMDIPSYHYVKSFAI